MVPLIPLVPLVPLVTMVPLVPLVSLVPMIALVSLVALVPIGLTNGMQCCNIHYSPILLSSLKNVASQVLREFIQFNLVQVLRYSAFFYIVQEAMKFSFSSEIMHKIGLKIIYFLN